MTIAPLYDFLSPIDVPLSSLFLDPNNPRFTNSDWQYIPEAEWTKPDVQEAAQRRLIHSFEVEKLRMNMEVNGYLPIDRVIVRSFGDGQYLVLEGNRRICAAKMVKEIGQDGANVNQKVLDSLAQIPCLLYTGNDGDAAWIFQGLRHISGIVEWSAFNKAKLLVEQMDSSGLTLTEVGRRFGLTPHGAGQWVRGYKAFEQARESSDYITEVDERSYPYFQELFGRSSAALREWLEWDEGNAQFSNKLNLDEFISWIYPRPASDEDQTGSKKGDFEKRRIARRDDLRQISDLITKHSDLFNQFRSGVDLEKSYSLALARQYEEQAKKDSDPVAELFDAVQTCLAAISHIPYQAMKNQETKDKILGALAELKNAIAGLD